MLQTQGKLIGLTGPSGVGKGFLKDRLKAVYPHLVELTVPTTRPRRPTDGADRETDIPVAVFLERSKSGEIIFAHQPFGGEDHWYGFYRDQIATLLASGQQVLTEVHVDNVRGFKKELGDQVTLIGLVAEAHYLAHNLTGRGSETEADKGRRLEMAIAEVATVHMLHQEGLIHTLIEVDHGVREQLTEIALRTVAGFFAEGEITPRGRGKETNL